MAVYGKQADVDANAGRNVQLWTPDTQMTDQDKFLGGVGTGVTDEMLNGAQRYAGNTAQDTANAYGATLNANNTPRYDDAQAMASAQQSAQGMQTNQVASAKAQLDATLQSQISQLSMAYEQAISDGQISVRDAQDAFAKQKVQVEQKAYQDAERTGIFSQSMGIQNSQQAQGLQAGDNARTNGLINTNMSERDKSISNIQDRLKALKNQQAISVVQASNEHDTGLMRATADAGMQYAQTMAGFQSDKMNSDRAQQNQLDSMAVGQGYTEDNMETQQGYTVENAETQQGYQKENMAIQQDYTKLNMAQQQDYVVKNMYTANKFDKEKMATDFANQIKMAGIQFSNASSLQAKQQRYSQANQVRSTMSAIDAEEARYQKSITRQNAQFDPKSKEGIIAGKQLLQASQLQKTEIYNKGIAESQLTQYNGMVKNLGDAPKDSMWKTSNSFHQEQTDYRRKQNAINSLGRKLGM